MFANFIIGDTKFRISPKLAGLIFLPAFLLLLSFVFGAMSYTAIRPLNNTIYSQTDIIFNTSITYTNITGCVMQVGLTNGTWAKAGNISMTNATSAWWNASVTTLVDSWNAAWHNVTYFCNQTLDGGNISSGPYYFMMDATNPVIEWFQNFTRANSTTSTRLQTMVNLTENNTNFVRVRIYLEDGTSTWYNLSLLAGNVSTDEFTYWGLNLTSAHLSQDGDVILEYWANDTANRSDYATSNETALVNALPLGTWTYVTYSEANMSIQAFANKLPNVTSVSSWTNDYAYKNYTTYSTSTPLINSAVQLRIGNATVIYATSADYYFRKNYLVSSSAATGGAGTYNMSLYTGITNCSSTFLDRYDCNATAGTNKTAWNLIGLYADKTMNETLYACANTSTPSRRCFIGNATGYPTLNTLTNITFVSWYNTSSGYQITCKYGWDFCTGCGASGMPYAANCTPTGISLKTASAVWVMPSMNFTLNRTAY